MSSTGEATDGQSRDADLGGVAAVLAGRRSYDTLDGVSQARVRDVWDQRMAAKRAALNLAEQFRDAGVTDWVTADPQGRTVYRS